MSLISPPADDRDLRRPDHLSAHPLRTETTAGAEALTEIVRRLRADR